ncbi:Endoribonuclease Dcr-1, partial [Armadillidium vulgare]
KGVALPTTSEETKKAKRENLQQKQILVPELCTIHPFPASLWRKAVCLPTILYRLNGLLLADELRVRVAIEIGLGLTNLTIGFEWPNLDFGWTLADVLARSIEASKEGKETSTSSKKHNGGDMKKDLLKKASLKKGDKNDDDEDEVKDKHRKGSGSDSVKSSEMEIGTWSNDMALNSPMPDDDANDDDFEVFDPNIELPANLTMLDGTFGADDDVEGELGADWGTGLTERKARCTIRTEERGGHEVVRVGSPSNFETDMGWDAFNGGTPHSFGAYGNPYDDFYDYCDDFEGFESEPEYEEEEEEESKQRVEDEWEEQSKRRASDEKENQSDEEETCEWPQECLECSEEKQKEFEGLIQGNKERLRNNTTYLGENEPLIIKKAFRKKVLSKTSDNSVQTDEKLLHTTPSVVKNGVSEDQLDVPDGEEESEKKSETHADKATQTDDVAFTHNTEPEILYNVDREKTLKEVKVASVSLPEVKLEENDKGEVFSFDRQPDLEIHAGPSPSIILQALTMSNANDGVNLERLETIGDSYLKYAITNYLYCTYTQKHEGKLSYLRSKQVSNLNLYRLGKRKGLGECMVATKFEPHDNWLPPGYFVPKELEEALIDSGVPAGHWNMADFPGLHDLGSEEIRRLVQERSEQIKQNKAEQLANELIAVANPQDLPIFIPYNLLTQHSIPDKSISDCVEALIGAYLTTCGPRGALLFMSWLGIKVLPNSVIDDPESGQVITYHQLCPPPSPLNACPLPDSCEQLELLLSGYCEFEKKIDYFFRDRSYLLQAFTHASYYRNKLTDCYQRLEFLGDAVLDYLITRHLFEDKRQHSPGSLTDLRSALVNNTIFACLAVKFEFHKSFKDQILYTVLISDLISLPLYSKKILLLWLIFLTSSPRLSGINNSQIYQTKTTSIKDIFLHTRSAQLMT